MRKLWLLLAVPIVILDQWVKWWAEEKLIPVLPMWSSQIPDMSRPFIPGVNLRYAENTGAAFSLFGGGGARWFLVAVSVLAVAAIILVVLKNWVNGTFGVITLSCVLGGAAGNLIDRAINGYVVDMFEFTFMRFAIFNVADVFITVGGSLFVLYVLIDEMKRKKNAPVDEDS
jgi:signal peptidase II